MTPLKTQAIQTALTGNWANAITLNNSILEETPEDIDTLNRLAFAHSSLGNVKEAKNIYQQVLQLDTQNPIALRNLKRLAGNNSTISTKTINSANISELFIEEPGKTKVIELLNVADKKVISPLRSGEEMTLSVKRMKVFVLDEQKQFVGMLPDDIGRRLILFMNGGNQYEAYIKSVDNNKVIIFAREVKRTSKFKDQPSFTPTVDKTKLSLTSKNNAKVAKKSEAESDEDKDDDDQDDEESF
jgi:hypothetical protein